MGNHIKTVYEFWVLAFMMCLIIKEYITFAVRELKKLFN